MKTAMLTTLLLAALAAFLPATFAQGGKPIPRGIRQADQAEDQAQKSIPPPSMSPRTDPKQLQKDADNLLQLSQSISAEMAQVNRGVLPGDLIEKLKRVEKLSKHLRSELAR